MQQLSGAIRSTILSSPYDGDVHVDYKTLGSNVYIRSEKFCMTLERKSLFSLFKYFRSKDSDGGRWEVCGSAYPLKQWVSATNQKSNGSMRYKQRPPGHMGKDSDNLKDSNFTIAVELLGVQEREWLRSWEVVIIRAVSSRYQSPIPLGDNGGVPGLPVRSFDLDGSLAICPIIPSLRYPFWLSIYLLWFTLLTYSFYPFIHSLYTRYYPFIPESESSLYLVFLSYLY
jgi:hypothetical protein